MQKLWFWVFVGLVLFRVLYSVLFQKGKNLIYTTSAYAIVGMYLISGLDKIINWGGDDTERLLKKWKKDGYLLDYNSVKTANFLVLAGGFMELIGSYLILSSVEGVSVPSLTENMAKIVGIYTLVIFTVLATLMFYIFPTIKVLPAISNINAIGGLLALLV